MLADKIVDWLKKVLEESGGKGYVVGLSGGIDSAVVAALIKQAAEDNSLGLIMPCHSNPQDEKDAREIADHLGLKISKIDLSPVYDEFLRVLPESSRLLHGNIKARLRMTTLYHHAALNNYLVAGTGNKTEYLIGYFTKYGDGACDVAPILDLLKREVRSLAEQLGIPQKFIEKAPSAGLWDDQTDEAEIGLSYDILDNAVIGLQKGSTVVPFDAIVKVVDLNKASEHKRNPPLAFKQN